MSPGGSQWGFLAYLVEFESLGVGLEGLFVVFLALLDEAEDMPADMRGEVKTHALLDEVDALVAPAHVDEDETLHAERLYG